MNNLERIPIRLTTKLSLIFVGFLFTIMCCATAVWAYFSIDVTGTSPTTLNVNTLFGVLNESPAGASWGTENNPYLIHTQQHLNNLYKIQNNKNRALINEDTFFQVSNPDSTPCYVGGTSSSNLLDIFSIGSEDFPFISTIRGVTGATYTLPDGEVTDTSAIANVRVTAQEGQIDIGLFGNVGPNTAPGDGQPVGEISNLLLANIQVATTSVGDNTKNNHPNFFTSSIPHETNHIGILAGHAQYTLIYDISVYYTDTNPTAVSGGAHSAKVPAFNINPSSAAKYTTSGGIIGYYKNLFINPNNTDHPVNSDGFDDFGGTNVGFGLGIVYSEDIWRFMEKNYFPTEPIMEKEYGIQDTFDEKLYGPTYNGTDVKQNKYFRIGVFTFAHSSQTLNDDRIAKLWKTAGSNLWSVSTSGNYTNHTLDMGDVSYRYACTQIQYRTSGSPNHFTSTSGSGTSLRATVTTTASNSTFYYQNYRFMLVAETTGGQYALTRYGYTAAAQKIDTNNFVIPANQLNYYTFIPYQTRTQDSTYPPYYNSNAYRYNTVTDIRINPTGTNIPINYFVYGNTLTNPERVIYEAERPLRIYDSISFMATSVAGSPEGIYLTMPGTGATGTNTAFRLRRSTSGTSTLNNYLTFSEGAGFGYTTSSGSATQIKIYAVRITNNPSNSSENPVATAYNKQIYTPTNNIKTYDMSTTTLHYVGNATSSTISTKYRYNIRPISSLEWAANDGNPITKAETVVKMADPTSYYYLNNAFWGVVTGIPAPSGIGTIDVPEASIGFTVNNTDNSTQISSRIFAIVATDPSQDVDQTITISYFNSSSSMARTEQASFPLPPVPGSTPATTSSIYVCDVLTTSCPTTSTGNLSYYHIAYPNLSTLLVSYEITVTTPARGTRTFFLEASKGSANFVYLSAERTASKDSNPTHENDLELQTLAGIDFVTMRSNIIQTVNRTDKSLSGGYYIQSLIAPYFGLKSNPANPDGANPNMDALALTPHTLDPYRFTWSIVRCYVMDKHEMYIRISDIAAYSANPSDTIMQTIMSTMNYNFTEWSYLDQLAYAYIYSDVVYTYLNSKVIDWTKISY